jgi:hypothetical protein
VKTGEHRLERALRWDDVFEQVRQDSAHEEIEGAVIVGVCADGLPELFVAGKSSPDEVIAEMKKLERFILDRCVVEPNGTLRWGQPDDVDVLVPASGGLH